MAEYQRPQIPYTPFQILPFSNRYDLTASENQPISSFQLDGDMNYLIDSLNALYIVVQGIAAGILPGAFDPTNVNKFPVTDGDGDIFWTKITAGYFSVQCIPTAAFQLGCINNSALGAACVGNTNIIAGAIKNNIIIDGSILFGKITIANSLPFQNFFNAQSNNTLSGEKIIPYSLPGTAITPGSLPGAALTTGTVPANALVANSITNAQLSPIVRTPIGVIMGWGVPGAAPVGWVLANGQLLNRVTYALLFAVYGTYFGAGDGVTTFGTPDTRGRALFGVDTTSGSPTGNRIAANPPYQPGSTGGEEFHTLTGPEMPVHSHSYFTYSRANAISSGGGNYPATDSPSNTGNAGSGSPHNNMPPYMLMNMIIYAGV